MNSRPVLNRRDKRDVFHLKAPAREREDAYAFAARNPRRPRVQAAGDVPDRPLVQVYEAPGHVLAELEAHKDHLALNGGICRRVR